MKAALYVRVSTMHQIDKDSLPFQRQELVNYAKYLLGIDDYEIFEDAGYSGKNTDRPKFQEMMSRIRAGEFTHMLVWKIDRISRNLLDFTKMYDELKKHNVIFISKNEQFDTSSAMGEAMLKIILIFAELERKLTGERVYSIMLSRAEKGLWNGAPMPLGYTWVEEGETKFPVVCPDEARTVQFIYDSYEELRSTMSVKHRLEANGISTKKGRTWTTKTIADILRNPFYVGTYRYNYREAGRGNKKPEDEWIVVEDNHESIISKEQYEKVCSILDAQKRGRNVTRTSHIHVFSHLIHCENCGKKHIASIDRPRDGGYRPSVYRCFNYVHSNKAHRACGCAIGEVKLGPFMLNYLANLVRAHDDAKLTGKTEHTEKLLLQGKLFKEIAGIHPEDLQNIHRVFTGSTQDILFDKIEDEGKNIEKDFTLDTLKEEKKKCERAMQRLEDLFLFSDDAMSEKDYLVRKQDLKTKIDNINKKIKDRSVEYSKNLPGHDLSFIKKATQYLLAQNLLESKHIDYNKLVMTMDKQLLKDLMLSVISRITVRENKQIASIEFTNGMNHRFVYRD
ncbi:recombinase family protein [Peptoclostridium sp.]|uniref:recombinase family protein n=1 Tax=Peptoclostridium sp. TaxID=1904860 RepID=UPI0025E15882|nr:recombinase family protein [Peptoclostridium sp.]